jgi:hypothetical protein
MALHLSVGRGRPPAGERQAVRRTKSHRDARDAAGARQKECYHVWVHRAPLAIAVLVLAGCSDDPGIVAPDGSVADVPENDTDADWVCLGHIDPSRGQGLVIRTSDGSPTIASVKLGAGTNPLVGASPCSYFIVEMPDASAGSGHPQVTVYMGSNIFIDSDPPWDADPAPCELDVVSVYGQSVGVTAGIIVQHRVMQHCVGNYDCCATSNLEWVGSREFYPPVQTVTFTQPSDASVDGATDISAVGLAPGLDGGIDTSGG